MRLDSVIADAEVPQWGKLIIARIVDADYRPQMTSNAPIVTNAGTAIMSVRTDGYVELIARSQPIPAGNLYGTVVYSVA